MSNQQELHGCTPRGCNTQLSGSGSATPAATAGATPSLKALAGNVLGRNTVCNSGATAAAEPVQLSAPKTPRKVALQIEAAVLGTGWSVEQLTEALSPADRADIEAGRIGMQSLRAFINATDQRKRMERGEVPTHYTATTVCARCGPVPVYPGLPEQVRSCPWCFNRLAGRPMPSTRNAGGDKA